MMISNEQENVIQLPVSVCEMLVFTAYKKVMECKFNRVPGVAGLNFVDKILYVSLYLHI